MTKNSQSMISVIILNWNGKEDTLECLNSVMKLDYRNYKVIVVDNGSCDGSQKAILDLYPDIILLQTGKNLGYAGGNNVGIRWALEHHLDYILILNNDTIISSDLLSGFIKASKNLPHGSVLGAKIYYYDRPDVLWFGGAHWRSYANGFEITGMGKIDRREDNDYIQADYITGCVLFAEAETYQSVGLLDEDFFLTYEETDWCYRARAKGYECFVVPDARVWHKVSSSFGGRDSPIMSYFMTRNKPLWAKKNLSGLSSFNLHIKILIDISRLFFPRFHVMYSDHPLYKRIFWAIDAWLTQLKINLSYPVIAAKLMGYRDFYLGRFGNCPDSVRVLKRKAIK